MRETKTTLQLKNMFCSGSKQAPLSRGISEVLSRPSQSDQLIHDSSEASGTNNLVPTGAIETLKLLARAAKGPKGGPRKGKHKKLIRAIQVPPTIISEQDCLVLL